MKFTILRKLRTLHWGEPQWEIEFDSGVRWYATYPELVLFSRNGLEVLT